MLMSYLVGLDEHDISLKYLPTNPSKPVAHYFPYEVTGKRLVASSDALKNKASPHDEFRDKLAERKCR